MTSLSVILVLCVTIVHSATSHPAHTDSNNGHLGIIGGSTIPIEDAPFMATLYSAYYDDYSFECGGSIIGEEFVLTSAKCCESLNEKAYIKVGGNKRKLEDGQVYSPANVTKHEYYDSSMMGYDACVIKLNDTLKFDSKIRKITLADEKIDLFDGVQLNVLGWGYTWEQGHYSHRLQEVSVPLVPERRCREEYKVLSPYMLCAGTENDNMCDGDEGGPLTFMNAIQVGIASYGHNCRVVGLYTDVSAMLPWINDVMDQYRT